MDENYEIKAYLTVGSRCPIEEYLEKCPNIPQVFLDIKYLKIYGPNIGKEIKRDLTKKLSNGIFELRAGRSRIIFIYCDKEDIILLHGFIKKTKKTPKEEIEKAKKEKSDYEQNKRAKKFE